MSTTVTNVLPSGRPRINLNLLFSKRSYTGTALNECVYVSLIDPCSESHLALVQGLRRILPFMYRPPEAVIDILYRYGMDLPNEIPIPTAFNFQWSHAGEILVCAYFEECENITVPTYKWRLNTADNQNPFGMDVLAFDLSISPAKIYAVAVKTTDPGENEKTPSVIYKVITELDSYLASEKLDDDLEVIAANFQLDNVHRQVFLDWYDPYSQGVPASKPTLVVVPAIVAESQNWDDNYASAAINHDFGVACSIRIVCIKELEELVKQTYARDS